MLKSFAKKRAVFLLFLLLGGMFLFYLPQAQALQIADYPSFLNIHQGMSLTSLISTLFGFLLTIAGIAAFAMVVLGGFKYLTSAGDPTKMGDAKNQIFSAALGLIILLVSWMVLNTINPQLVDLREPGVPEPRQPGPLDSLRSGVCVDGQSYDVEIYSKKNFKEDSLFRCFNAGESQEKGLSSNPLSVKVNNSSVQFFEEPNFGGRNICFTSDYPNLNDCNMRCGLWGCDEWKDDVKSLKVIGCNYPGITFNQDGSQTDDPIERCVGF